MTTTTTENEADSPIHKYDKKNSKSFGLISKIISEPMLQKIFDDVEELQMMPEDAINKLAEPNAMLWELRVRLWQTIEDREAKYASFAKIIPITSDDIIKGICSRGRLYRIVDDKFKCEFLSRPLRDYQNSAEDLTRAAQARIWEVLSLPIKDNKGVPDKNLTKIVFDCAKMVLDRKYGQAIQKTELYAKVQSQSLHITKDLSSPEAIDAEIKRLEGVLNGQSPTKDVEVTAIAEKAGTQE